MNNKNLKYINSHAELDSASSKRPSLTSPVGSGSCYEIPDQVRNDGIGSESGRSMVEMLGVLAVMGLLTIIGITGFKMAMNKAKANNLVADMNRLAHIVVMDKFSGYSEEAIENAVAEHNQKTEYQAEYEYRTPQVFALKNANPIDKDMCQQVANLGWNLPIAMYLNKTQIEDTFDAEACTDSNQLTWFFTNDLSQCPDCALSLFNCERYGNECGKCDPMHGYTTDEGPTCTNPEKPYCFEGYCSYCNQNQVFGQNDCWACTGFSQYIHSVPQQEAYKCLGIAYYDGNNHMCACGWNEITGAEERSCKACDERCYIDGKCFLFETQQNMTRDTDGSCVCASNYFFSRDGNYCRPCQTGYQTSTNTASSEAHKCLGQDFYANGTMYHCDSRSGQPSNSDEESCKACSERCFDATNNNNTCRLLSSGYGRDAQGNCTN